ncbi:MAG: class I SAM-dependent methyltransferase [Ilumatobacter sp.]
MSGTPGDDAISRFYDAHPYPPPTRDLEAVRRSWADGTRRRIEHIRRWPTRPFRDDPSILVAGCGTSQAAKYAIRHPQASVVGIDVSESSLRATQDLAERYELTNLEVHRLAIEEIASLSRSFDHVVCTGVLHHLDHPATGLGALASVLAPHGALDLMVYASYGRMGVAMIQEYCRMLAVSIDSTDIADLVTSLRELPIGHPIGHLLRNTPDFSDDDALADALLNPREQSYSVPELLDLLASADLRFGRWVRQAPYRPQCGVMTDLPHGERIGTLPLVEQYAALELFRGTMLRHSLIAHRASDSGAARGGEFDVSPRDVPFRTPTSTAITEKLPRGVSAALLNRAHTYPDLVLFASADELRWFEQIDGSRSVGDITDDIGFFERLWQHDLIVLDASPRS